MIWYIKTDQYNEAIKELGGDATLKEVFNKVPNESIMGYNPTLKSVDHMFLFQMENLVKEGIYTMLEVDIEEMDSNVVR